jgi:hypothetical protein
LHDAKDRRARHSGVWRAFRRKGRSSQAKGQELDICRTTKNTLLPLGKQGAFIVHGHRRPRLYRTRNLARAGL